MKKVILGIGIPGAGKSTVLKSFSLKNNYIYICPDEIRLELTGNVSDQTKNKEVWQLTYERVKAGFINDITVIVDATFANSSQRQDFLNFLKKIGVTKIQGLYVDTPLEIAKERNSQRGRTIPWHALERMNKMIVEVPPSLSEGFDTVFVLDEKLEMKEAHMSINENEIRKEFKMK